MAPNFWDDPELLLCSSLVILHKSTLLAVQRTSRRLQDEDKSDLWAPWVMSLHLPAAHPPNAPESTGNGNQREKCLQVGLRLQMKSFWMLQNREQGFQELFDITDAWENTPQQPWHGALWICSKPIAAAKLDFPSTEMCHKHQFFVLQQRSRFLLQFSKA